MREKSQRLKDAEEIVALKGLLAKSDEQAKYWNNKWIESERSRGPAMADSLERGKLEKHERRERQRARKKEENERAAALAQIPRQFRRLQYAELTYVECAKALEKQENQCAICAAIKPLVRDHNHRTKAFRAFLCSGCNHIVGQLETDTYLKEFFQRINTEEAPEEEARQWYKIVERRFDLTARIERAGGHAKFLDYLRADHLEEMREWWRWVEYCESHPEGPNQAC